MSHSNSGVTNSKKYESISFQVHKHIESIQQHQLNADLNIKEKVVFHLHYI